MDNQIFLTSPIDNEHGFVDWIQMITEWRKDQGDLNAIIDSPGGNIFGGFRMARAIAEHPSKTIAHVRGIAASMAGVLLAFFDKVTIDEHSTIMLHQAHINGESGEEVSETDQKALNDFNKTAAKLMKKRGMSQKLVNQIFKGEAKDFWFTAQEAKDAGIVDEITKVVRKNDSPTIKIAAYLENSQNKYNQYINNMSLFSKSKKPENTSGTVQSGEIEGGVPFVFNSKESSLAVGDSVARIGSEESLEGTHKLVDGREIVIDAKQVVTEIGEEDNSVEARLAIIEAREDLPTSEEVKKLTDAFNGYTAAMKAAGNGSGFRIPKVDSKNELDINTDQSDASLASEMRGVIKAVETDLNDKK
jgi:ATP-dependent protease ClpP protease subunit